MNNPDMSLEDFIKIIPEIAQKNILHGEKDPNPVTEDMDITAKLIYYWCLSHPNQKQDVVVRGLCDTFNIKSSADTLRDFGIIDPAYATNLNKRSEFFITLHKNIFLNGLDVLNNYVSKFVEDNLPDGTNISIIVVTDSIDYVEYKMLADLMCECPKLRGVHFLNDFSKFQATESRYARLEDLLDEYKRNYHVTDFINITDGVLRLQKEYTVNSNYNTYTLFQNLISDIVTKVENIKRKNPNRVPLVYTEEENLMYVIVAAQLNYFYNISSLTMDVEWRFIKVFSELIFNPQTMQAGDVINYVKYIPSHLCKITEYGLYALYCNFRTLKYNLTCVELDENNNFVGELCNKKIDLCSKNIKVSNVTTLYPFTSQNIIKESDKKLHELLLDFYKLNGDLVMCHPGNTFIYEIDDKRFLAKIESVASVEIGGVLYSLELHDCCVFKITNLQDLVGWIPIEFFVERNKILNIINYIVSHNVKVDINYRKYIRTANKDDLFFRHLFAGGGGITYAVDAPKESFISCMMNTPELVKHRNNRVWYEIFKDNPKVLKQLTSFYCENLMENKSIILDEECLATKDLIRGGMYE